MSTTNRWWARFDKRWKKVPYGDGSKQHFWTRNTGLFILDVEPKRKGHYVIGVSALDGSIDNCWHQEFRGNLKAAQAAALDVAHDIAQRLSRLLTLEIV